MATPSNVRVKDNSSAGIPDSFTVVVNDKDSMARVLGVTGIFEATASKMRGSNPVTYQITGKINPLYVTADVTTALEEAAVLANLGIDITASPMSAAVAGNITLTITASNAANVDEVDDVVVNVTIPAGFDITSNTPAANTTYNAGVWTIGKLAANTSKVLTLVGDAASGQGGTTKTINVSIDGTLTDSSSANNTDSVQLTITP